MRKRKPSLFNLLGDVTPNNVHVAEKAIEALSVNTSARHTAVAQAFPVTTSTPPSHQVKDHTDERK